MGDVLTSGSAPQRGAGTLALVDAPPPGSPSLFDRANGIYRSTMRFLGQRTLARATLAVPRTIRFLVTMKALGQVAEAVPAPALTLGLAAQVAIDEVLLAAVMTPKRFPTRADYERLGAEMAVARALYVRRGWIERPDTYHRRPPALGDADLTRAKGWANRISYERISFPSGFHPRPEEPGAFVWEQYEKSHTATAVLLRHPGEPRPWVVCVHGFGTGYAFMDFQGFAARRLHHELGLNVAMPVLPLHGPRKVTRMSGEPFLSFELMNGVHGLTQSAWDVRRLIGWLRAEGAPSIALYGISLGGNVVSLLAGLEEVDAVVAGIPVSDFPQLFIEHSPERVRTRSFEHQIMGGATETVYKVVSPFSFAPKVARDRRFIYAGLGDRLATPRQAYNLWEHWEEPTISWYAGNHVGYLWSRQVGDFLVRSLASAGFAHGRLDTVD